AGWKYAERSIRYTEVSVMSPAGMPVFQFKVIIVAAGILLFLQGCAQVMRCLVAIRTGEWVPHDEDVEELEDKILREAAERKAREAAEAEAEAPEDTFEGRSWRQEKNQ
ncbi:MAG: hypothetical protein AAFR44_09505, partial [Pseudomonadota bacterium]